MQKTKSWFIGIVVVGISCVYSDEVMANSRRLLWLARGQLAIERVAKLHERQSKLPSGKALSSDDECELRLETALSELGKGNTYSRNEESLARYTENYEIRFPKTVPGTNSLGTKTGPVIEVFYLDSKPIPSSVTARNLSEFDEISYVLVGIRTFTLRLGKCRFEFVMDNPLEATVAKFAK